MNRNKCVPGLVMIFFMLAVCFGAGCTEAPSEQVPGDAGVDVLTLDSMAALGELERPVVRFPHDLHAEVLGGADGCQMCHSVTDGRWTFDFVSSSKTAPRAVRDAWHRQCLTCHQEPVTAAPLTCGGCHTRDLPSPPGVAAASFYDTYHAFHEYLEGGCGLCHHEYDAETGELYYAEGYETACWSCHPETRQDDIPSLKEASHMSCVGCHTDINRKDMMGLPVNCSGCHREAGL